jgi:hypothetical protein
MKKTLLIALLLIPFLGMSQTTKPIEGFLGIKFGTSKADLLAAMKAKEASLDASSTTDDLYFTHVSLGHRATDFIRVRLFNDKVYFAAMVFSPENDASTLGYYAGLVNDISDVYGKGKPTIDFKAPYKYGDGDETTAIFSSEGKMFTNWQSGSNSIQVTITTKLKVILFYIDDATQKLAEAAQKEKEKSAF